MTLISDREVTQVWEGVENTVGRSLDVLYKLQKSCDSCVDRNGPSVILTTEPIRQAHLDLKRRGIRIRLFSKFATKSQKGTGLGLYISKGIVEAHGGMIWVENNKDGRGAKFTFILPTAID